MVFHCVKIEYWYSIADNTHTADTCIYIYMYMYIYIHVHVHTVCDSVL